MNDGRHCTASGTSAATIAESLAALKVRLDGGTGLEPNLEMWVTPALYRHLQEQYAHLSSMHEVHMLLGYRVVPELPDGPGKQWMWAPPGASR